MFNLAKLIIGILLGFFIPGYLLSVILNSRLKLISSFIISYIVMFYSVFIIGILGFPITFSAVILLEIFISMILLLWIIYKKKKLFLRPVLVNGLPEFKAVVPVLLPFAVMLVFLGRVITRPLLSHDSTFRWNFLAQLILKHKSFSFYPPMSAHDYSIYFYSDGIPPIVSFSYFCLYSPSGAVNIFLTGVLVFFQFAATAVLCFKTAELLFKSTEKAYLALIIFISSSLIFFSFLIGQETGLTALAMAAVLYYILQAEKGENYPFFIAGAAAALGALSREYGLIFLPCGILFCLWRKHTLKSMIIFTLTVTIFSSPWYIRNWIITGNPFYSNLIADLFPVNNVHVGIFKVYVFSHSVLHDFKNGLLTIARNFLYFSPLHIPLFFLLWFYQFRKIGFIITASCMIILLWLYSIGQTTGGIFYSMRVLSPALVLISIAGAGAVADYLKFIPGRVKIGIFTLFAAWALYLNITIPYLTWDIPVKDWGLAGFSPVPNENARIFAYFERLGQNQKVLSDSAFYQAGLLQENLKNTGMVAVWSPEVGFLFNKDTSFEQSCQKLQKMNIKYVLYSRESHNNIYLDQFAFFSQYRKHSKMIAIGNDCIVYKLP